MRYRLSFLIPVRFTSTYTLHTGTASARVRSRWVQWRGRIWRHTITPA